MSFLRTASFGNLFTVAFTIAATCQVAMTLLGVITVFASPGVFKMNGVAASDPVQAFGVLVFLLVFCVFINAGMSAVGSAIWLLVRRALPRAVEPA